MSRACTCLTCCLEQEGQCGPGDHDGFDGHCADLVPVATPRSGNGRVRAATSCRPPRPSSTIAIEARDASPDSTSFRCGLPPLPRMDSAQTISRPESQQGRTPSILRTSRSRERSNSQSKRVSFSGDCKPAPPASINDLIHQCKAHPDARPLKALLHLALIVGVRRPGEEEARSGLERSFYKAIFPVAQPMTLPTPAVHYSATTWFCLQLPMLAFSLLSLWPLFHTFSGPLKRCAPISQPP
eukprot:s6083_g3.t1